MGRRGTDGTTLREPPAPEPEASDESVMPTHAKERDDHDLDGDTPLPDRFEPIVLIGRGGMGKVMRCRDRTLNREVAVKLMHAVQSEHVRQRFLHEARAIGMLHHPNIVTVHDAAPGGEYLVMELIDGESLASRIRRKGRLPAAEVHRIGGALLGALAAAHRQRIIHRDVKPSNVLLDGTGTVKLTDFGIASIADSELTHTGDVIGTPAYMAPEQLRGGRATERSDVYATGATLFEAATGQRLFKDGRRLDAPAKIVLEITGDGALAAAIEKAVCEDESGRFATAEEFGKALATRPRSRRRWLLAPALVAAGGLAAGAMYLRSRPDDSGPATTRRVTIAMLPFDDRVHDPQLDFASSGLPHLLGEQLGHFDRVDVLGYYRVSGRVPDSSAPLSAWLQAARSLGADIAVRGTLVPAEGGAVRITIIVERSDGRPLDQLQRDVPVDQVPATVQSLASAIASTATGRKLSVSPQATGDFEIVRELELGVAALERMDLPAAREHLNAVVTRDASVAEAYYYLAILDWWQQVDLEVHIERALAGSLGPTQRDFLVGLRKIAKLEYPAGLDYFRDLAKRAPDNRDVQYGLFEALFHGGYPTESMEVYRRLRELAPGFHVGIEHALQYYLDRGDRDGIEWVRAHWDPTSDEKPLVDARALLAEHREAEAIQLLERAVEEQPNAGAPIRRLLVETYAATGQLALAAQANDRLATIDPDYAALAAFGLAVARGQNTAAGIREHALHAIELGIPGLKLWAARSDLLAIDIVGATPGLLRDEPNGLKLIGKVPSIDIGSVMIATVLGDTETIEAARRSTFPQVAAVADAVVAEQRGDRAAAAAAWRRSTGLNSDGRLQLIAWYSAARNLREAHDHAGVIAACDEVISPRVFTWAWASTVGPCLRWSAEAATALGRDDDARRRWRSLLALRSAAPPADDLSRAARTALAGSR